MGMFDLYRGAFRGLESKLSVTAGGVLGTNLNQYIFNNFGKAGAGILFLMLVFISLLFLTNFQLGDWLRGLWGGKAAPKDAAVNGELTPDERALEKRARELEKQARKLQEQVEKAGGGLGSAI